MAGCIQNYKTEKDTTKNTLSSKAVPQSQQSVQSLSHVWLFETPWTIEHQASLSITNSLSLLKLMSIESVIPSNHLILCHPFLLMPSIFPSIRVFSNESVLRIRWPNYLVSASASVLHIYIQDWFPLGWSGWISLQDKGLSRVFSNTIQKYWSIRKNVVVEVEARKSIISTIHKI